MTSQPGILKGTTIELENAAPEMDGKRVLVTLEPFEEEKLSAQQQSNLWQTWIETGPQGPIEDESDTEFS